MSNFKTYKMDQGSQVGVTRYTTIIKIADVKRKQTKNGDWCLDILDEEGRGYRHYIDPNYDGWEQHLVAGNKMAVYVIETPHHTDPERRFRKIRPNLRFMEPIQDI